MPQIMTPEVTLEYETVGSPADPPLLLVMGFGAQLIAWPRRLRERLAAGDFGRAAALAAYTLSAMADDGLALLTALSIERSRRCSGARRPEL